VKVLVAMSGGVDSSVAAALALDDGHEVVGATMKLWGGPSDSGCCSVGDVDDARRVAQQLGIVHHVFNFSDEFSRHVVDPYVAAHAASRTPNPCIECNRHLKFDRLLERADLLGFDAVATGHHARVEMRAGGGYSLLRGADPAKDQSYVLHMLGQTELRRVLFPIGSLTKAEVRAVAARRGLRTAAKADSQDVCFISRKGGREAFLGARIPMRPAAVVDTDGLAIGTLPALELVTVGQRRGLGSLPTAATPSHNPSSHNPSGGPDSGEAGSGKTGSIDSEDRRRYVVAVDPDTATVTVGPLESLLVREIRVSSPAWVDGPPEAGEPLEVQMSAHGAPVPARWSSDARGILVDRPVRRVAPGQSVVLYRGVAVVGGGTAL
jgi:tRNA-uridine 2-sulfurtransferase